MCGLTGFINPKSTTNNDAELRQRVHAMTTTIAHRGPDGHSYWVDAQNGVALGHRRLAIIDLSEHGRQPMLSHSGQYVLSYNGEIYNFQELRDQLLAKGAGPFHGHSDTEVILEAFAVWGIEKALSKFVGMFALALWDRKNQSLVLARDRLGIKPLYWGHVDNGLFLFGSELKALRVHPNCSPRVNKQALALMMRHGYVPAPYSIYQDIQHLAPGHMLHFDLKQQTAKISCYWNALQVAQDGINSRDNFSLSDAEATDQLEHLLKQAVKCRMISDVPLGAFLSGGIDSSAVVALMQTQSSQPTKTFSIGFAEAGYNEAHHAKEVARHLKTDHTELYVTPDQALDVIPKLAQMYDEPFADASQIPTHLVSQLARQHVTVSLSGDGGDELFAGYNRYLLANNIWSKVNALPSFARKSIAGTIGLLTPHTWNRIGCMLPFTPDLFGDKLHKFKPLLTKPSEESLYLQLISQWHTNEDIVRHTGQIPSALESVDMPTLMDRMQYWDLMTYLPSDILPKVDRASMAVSLEARVPLLDHRVVEFAWSLPQHMKIRGGKSKWLLRQVLDRYVPSSLIDRPKMGFGVPIDTWLKGPLRDWAEDLLDENHLIQEGIFNPALIREKWQQHLKGSQNWQYPLWVVLMFQAWRREWQQDVQPSWQTNFSSQSS
ncbi:MAG: asparagine synthase (glutamine-hydrolyzing) [Pseudomonadota bacterium]